MRLEAFIGKNVDKWQTGRLSKTAREVLLNTDDDFILLSAAFRSGKSHTLGIKAIQHCRLFPQARVIVFRQHLASLKKSTMLTILGLIRPEWIADVNTSELTITFKNGSMLQFMSAEFSDRLGSIEASMVLIDELSELSRESFNMIQARLSQTLTQIDASFLLANPAMIPYAKAWLNRRQLFAATNTKARSHWIFEDWFVNTKPGYKAYTLTTFDNKNLSKGYLYSTFAAMSKPKVSQEEIEQTVDAILDGSLDAQDQEVSQLLTVTGRMNLQSFWLSSGDAVYPSENVSDAIVSELPKSRIKERYMGLDFGFNHPALIVVYELEDGRYITVDYFEGSQLDSVQFAQVIAEYYRKHQIDRVFYPSDDPGQVKLLRQEIGASSLRKAKMSVLNGIASVRYRLETGKLLILDTGDDHCKTFKDQLFGYSWKKTRAGIVLDEPEKVFDHLPDALRMIVYTLDRSKPIAEIGGYAGSDKEPDEDSPVYPYNKGLNELADKYLVPRT